MDDKFQKTFIITLFVASLIFTIIGGTFAYLSVEAANNNTTIGGSTYNFDVNLEATTIRSGNLIPVVDNLVVQSLNSTHVCEDTRGYSLCSLYRLRFTNSGSAQNMVGNMKTVSSTYTTSNLKYRLYTLNGNTYTALSDIGTVNNNTNAINYFESSGSNVTLFLENGSVSVNTVDVYLVIWISDPGSNQINDQNKSYTGQLSFVSAAGNTLTSTFTT